MIRLHHTVCMKTRHMRMHEACAVQGTHSETPHGLEGLWEDCIPDMPACCARRST
jgi:hypothetical protein